MMEFNCIEDGHVGLEALPKLVSASSCVAFTKPSWQRLTSFQGLPHSLL